MPSLQFVRLFVLVGMIAAVFVPATAVADSSTDASWTAKVDPWVLERSRSGASEFLVFLTEQADLSQARFLDTKLAKGTYVYETLSSLAERSQQDILKALDARGVEYRSYWITNMIWVRGDLATVQAMAERNDIFHIYANPRVHLDKPVNAGIRGEDRSPRAVEWNIEHVNADDVWALGFDGSGVVVAGQDTGYMWDHPALINQYRGGPSGDHAYSWHDAVHSGGGSCGADSDAPCDDHGHGTHTMGTVVGDDGLGNQVGMAPGAKWIGCRNMDQGDGTPATYAECFQFFIAPTDLNNENPDPAMAPDVINNSWGCPVSEGCTDPNVLLTVVQNVRAAGIFNVQSAGNDGSSCSSINTPAATYDESFSVGATSPSDAIASFSSRGPVTVDGSNRAKPDISAPGVDIRSSTRDGGYQGGWDGTSMAGPHVAGLVALVLDVFPGLAGDIDMVESVIAQSAVPLTTTQGCGGDSSTDVPNNVFGWGRIDALAAAQVPLDFLLLATPETHDVCIAGSADINIEVQSFLGFSEAVSLSTSALPAATTSSFSANPVTPPGISLLTLDIGSSAPLGSHVITVSGIAGSITRETTVAVSLFDQGPSAPVLSAPADGAVAVAPAALLSWQAVGQAAVYDLEVASDAAFASIVYSTSLDDTSHQMATALAPLTNYFWHIRALNPCGDGAWSPTFTFTTADIPSILVVDDDDNSPDVRSFYTAAFDSLGLDYDVWDTGNTDSNEPGVSDLAPYHLVVWFTGDAFGGAAGPGATTETALESWLLAGNCLFISSQEYHYDKNLTTFMQTRLGVSLADDDVGQTSVSASGDVFAGLGPYSLVYPFSDYADELTPDATSQLAFTGTNNGAALTKTGTSYKTSFWAFPFEALPSDADRVDVLSRIVDWCGLADDGLLFESGFESGDLSEWTPVSR